MLHSGAVYKKKRKKKNIKEQQSTSTGRIKALPFSSRPIKGHSDFTALISATVSLLLQQLQQADVNNTCFCYYGQRFRLNVNLFFVCFFFFFKLALSTGRSILSRYTGKTLPVSSRFSGSFLFFFLECKQKALTDGRTD